MKYEVLTSNCFYHIFNRGNNGENIFIENINYSYFLKLIKRHITPVADIYSYCLLKNHFHLLIRTNDIEDKLLSQAFSNFFNAYSKAINKKYNRSGSLFQDRFKRIKIKDENYLKELIIYINLNPVYHSFSSDIFSYKHSSLTSLLSNKKTLLKREEVLSFFEDKENFKFYITNKKIVFDEKMKELILE